MTTYINFCKKINTQTHWSLLIFFTRIKHQMTCYTAKKNHHTPAWFRSLILFLLEINISVVLKMEDKVKLYMTSYIYVYILLLYAPWVFFFSMKIVLKLTFTVKVIDIHVLFPFSSMYVNEDVLFITFQCSFPYLLVCHCCRCLWGRTARRIGGWHSCLHLASVSQQNVGMYGFAQQKSQRPFPHAL